MLELRDYQTAAVEALRRAYAEGRRRILLVAPTGAGKGTLITWLLARSAERGRPALFLVHREEILQDLYVRLRGAGVADEHLSVRCGSGLLVEGKRLRARPLAPIQLGTIQTLAGKASLPPAQLVVVDEAHRTAAGTYRRVLEHYPDAMVLGLTATPCRTDGQGLGDHYDHLHEAATMVDLLRTGWLCPLRIYDLPPEDAPDLATCERRGGDFADEELERVYNTAPINGHLVDHYLRYGGGRQGFVFAVSVAHSEALAARFTEAGVAAVHVGGKTPRVERRAHFAAFRAGAVRLLCSRDLLVEGVDLPSAKVLVFARPTESLTIYRQAVGRILRPYEGQEGLLLDHAGNVARHGVPWEPREWSLHGPPKRPRAVPTWVCVACRAIQPATRTHCQAPHPTLPTPARCGAARPPPENAPPTRTLPTERDVELRERPTELPTPADLEHLRLLQQQRTFRQLWETAYAEGFDAAWVQRHYRKKYQGAYPNPTWTVPPRPVLQESLPQRLAWLQQRLRRARAAGHSPTWVYERYLRRYGEPAPEAYAHQIYAPASTEQRSLL